MIRKILKTTLAVMLLLQTLLPLVVYADEVENNTDFDEQYNPYQQVELETLNEGNDFGSLDDEWRQDYLEEPDAGFVPFEERGVVPSSLSVPNFTTPSNIAPHRPNVYREGFPVLSIDMDVPFNWDGSTADLQFFRDAWQGATLNVSNTDAAFLLNDVRISARGRGNSTWVNMGVKRPIRFRFPNNAWLPMFDSGYVGRDWVLLANTIDPSHLRNFSALYLGDQMGSMPFVPNAWFVHLYLDGEYRGVYMLTDEREAIEGRGNLSLDIDPMISEYMIEFDARASWGGAPRNSHWVRTRVGDFDIRYPSTGAWMNHANNPHALYVERFLNRVDEAIVSGERQQVEAILDVASFIDFYLVQELMKNIDVGFSSVFYQIRGQGDQRRLVAGPLWDFDLSSGSARHTGMWPADIDDPRGAHAAATNEWFRLLLETPWFRREVARRWSAIRDVEVSQLLARIQYMALVFEDDFQRDLDRWPNHGRHGWNPPAIAARRTSLEQAEYLHWWLSERIEWMDEWLDESTLIPAHTVTVTGGTVIGGETHEVGATVEIRANEPEEGYLFSHWEATPAVAFMSYTAETTTFVMPAADIVITAVFEEIPIVNRTVTFVAGSNGALGTPNPNLTIVQGATLGSAATIPAQNPVAGHEFAHWTSNRHSGTFTTAQIRNLVITENTTFTAVFRSIPVINRTVTFVSGANGALGTPNQPLTVASGGVLGSTTTLPTQNPSVNFRFAHWTSNRHSGTFTTAQLRGLAIVENTTFTAVFERIPRTLTVNGGSGGGTIGQGASRTIRANAPRAGYRFDRWTTTTQGVTFANARSATTTMTMPARNATVTATFVRRTAANPTINRRRPGVIRNVNVPLRRGPGTAYHLNRRLPRGQQITVLNNGRNGWRFVQVGTGNVRGWIQTSQITEITSFGIVTGTNVPMRAGVNSGAIMTRLSRNASITILGTNGNRTWTQVRTGSRTGWVRTNQIRTLNRPGRTTRRIAMRRGPGTTFGTVRTLNNNTTLQVLGRQGNWMRIRAGNQTGWVQTNAARTTTPAMRTRRQIQLRQGPGTSFARIANSRVNTNTRVTVLARQGNWSRIRIGQRTGWVQTNQLR